MADPQAEVVQLLTRYQTTTEKLLELVDQAQEVPDLEQFTQLLEDREQVLEAHRQLPGDPVEDSATGALWESIQHIEGRISEGLDRVRHNLQVKMNNIQKQKVGLHAYRQEVFWGAAFIDQKK